MKQERSPLCPIIIKARRPGLSVRSCENCGGRAIGVELLRHIFTPERINPLWLHATKGEGQSGRSCPSRRNSMIEVTVPERFD